MIGRESQPERMPRKSRPKTRRSPPPRAKRSCRGLLSSGRYGPESFVRVLTAEDPPPVVIGGQAVNLWALWALERHDHEYPRSRLAELDRLAPFTSRDCDVLGDRELLHRLAAKSGWPATVFPHGASRAVGYLVSPDDQGLMVEILHSVRGLGPDTAGLDVTIVRGGRSYRT